MWTATHRNYRFSHITKVCSIFNLKIFVFSLLGHCVLAPHPFQKVSTGISEYIKNV